MKRITSLPIDIQRDWGAAVIPAAANSAYRLVKIRRTEPRSFEEQRIIVAVIDENNIPLSNVPIAFSYSTAPQYPITENFKWIPPGVRRADIAHTKGSGEIDHIQGSAVKPDEPGGVSVYVLDPEYSSDVLVGLGMLADHTGLHVTFQLQREDVRTIEDTLRDIIVRLADHESRLMIIETSR